MGYLSRSDVTLVGAAVIIIIFAIVITAAIQNSNDKIKYRFCSIINNLNNEMPFLIRFILICSASSSYSVLSSAKHLTKSSRQVLQTLCPNQTQLSIKVMIRNFPMFCPFCSYDLNCFMEDRPPRPIFQVKSL